MTQAFNLSQLANNLNSSGQLDATDGLTGAVPVANGGTGASSLTANNVLLGNGTSAPQTVAPSTSGNFLRSNGTTWVSQAVSVGSGTVTSVATGNGLSGGTITSTGTLVIACPGYNTVGSYTFARKESSGTNTLTAGTSYAGSTINPTMIQTEGGTAITNGNAGTVSGTWRNMGGNSEGTGANCSIYCRIS